MSITTVRWGIVSTGNMAHQFVKDLLLDPATRDVHDIKHIFSAVSSTSIDRGKAFVKEFSSEARVWGSIEELVQDPEVDAIYIASPTNLHYQHALTGLNAGKAILCEKAFTINAAQASHLIRVALEKKVYLAEALWTRYFPITLAIKEALHSKHVLGKIIRVSSDLSIDFAANDLAHRLRDAAFGGGALLAVGVYPLTWVMLALFSHPENDGQIPQLATAMVLTDEKAAAAVNAVPSDDTTIALLTFPKLQATAIVSCSVLTKSLPGPSVTIQGTLGNIIVPLSAHRPQSYILELFATESTSARTETHEEFAIPGKGLFYQADALARGLRDGRVEPDEYTHADTLAMMEVMDRIRAQGNFRYPGDLEDVQK